MEVYGHMQIYCIQRSKARLMMILSEKILQKTAQKNTTENQRRKQF